MIGRVDHPSSIEGHFFNHASTAAKMNLVLLRVPALEGKLRQQLAPIRIASLDHRRDGAAFAVNDCVNRRVIDCIPGSHPNPRRPSQARLRSPWPSFSPDCRTPRKRECTSVCRRRCGEPRSTPWKMTASERRSCRAHYCRILAPAHATTRGHRRPILRSAFLSGSCPLGQ